MGNSNSTLLNREEAEKALFGDVSAPPVNPPSPALSVEQRYDFNNRLNQLQQLIESDTAPASLKKVPHLSKDQQRILLRKYMHREIFTVHQGPADLPENPHDVTFKETYLVHRDYKKRSKSAHVPRSEPVIRSPDEDDIEIISERRLERPGSDSMSEASFTSAYSENFSERDFEPPLSPQRSPDKLDVRPIRRGSTPIPEALLRRQTPIQTQQHHDHVAHLQHHDLHVQQHSRESSASDSLNVPKQRGRKQRRSSPQPDLRPRSKSDGHALAASMVRLTPDEQTLAYPSREASPDRFDGTWGTPVPQQQAQFPHQAHHHSQLAHEIPVLPPPMEFERTRARARELKQKQTDEFVQDSNNDESNQQMPKSKTMPSMTLPSMPSLPMSLPKRHSMPIQAPTASAADIFEIPAVPAAPAKEKTEKLSLFKRLAHRRRSMTEKAPPPLIVDDKDLDLTLTIPAIPVSARKMTSEPEDSPLVANRLSSITRPKTRPPQPRAKSMYVPRETPIESPDAYPFQARGNELSKHINDLSNQPWQLTHVPQLSPERFVKRTDTAGSLGSMEELQRTNTVTNSGHILDAGIPPKVPTHRSLTIMSQSSGTSSDDYFSVGSRSPELSYSSAIAHAQGASPTPHSTDIYTRKCSYRRPKLQTRKTEPAPISVSTVAEVETPPVTPEDDLSYEQEIEEEIAARQFMLCGYKKSSTKLQVVNWQKDAFMNSSTTLGDLSHVGTENSASPVPPPLPFLPRQKQQTPRKYHKKGGSDAFSFEEDFAAEQKEQQPRLSEPQVSAAQQTYLDLINNDDMWADQGNDYFNFGS
ncbi:hypothetical protein CJU89_0178 [Yarrowia sp. B02]|nr:hypothetical protein CJU89_0178 [Yarrowia sp. B02]